MKRKAIIFDLDNTIVSCSEYYINAKHRFADLMSLETGISQNSALEILNIIDLQNLKMRGVVRSRYPQSFEAACAAVEILMGKQHSKQRTLKSWRIGNSVFRAPYPLLELAWETLETLKRSGYEMFICTKGDSQVQLRKIKKKQS